MKKILQRIGLLAMAGMLLWGWQGMEAKAEVTDDTIGLVRDYTKLENCVLFTWQGAVIAAVVVSFPIMYRAARGALEQVDVNLIYAARTLGMSETKIFFRIQLPAAWPGVAAATILAFARAMGEFGATIMLAGNIPGRTQTMSVAIYTAVQSGDRSLAYYWVAIIMGISFFTIFLMNYWMSYQERRGGGKR